MHISKRIWSLRNCKTEDTSKLSGLQASVYRMNGNLQYSHDVVLLQNSYRGRGGLPCLFPNITAVFSVPAHPCHVGRRLQLAVPEPPLRWGGWHPGEDSHHSAPVLLQTDVHFLIQGRCILTTETTAGSIFKSHISGHTHTYIHIHTHVGMYVNMYVYR